MSPSIQAAHRHSARRGRAARTFGSGLLALAVAAVAVEGPAASAAAPGAPVITAPGGTVSVPEIAWRPVSGADGYEVQIDNDSSFSSPEWRSSTVNTVSVPTKPLTPGTQHVRVRAKAKSDWGRWTQRTFELALVPGPALATPVEGARLAQPDEAPLLSWSPVPGAVSYTVEVDTDSDFVGAKVYDKVAATSFVVPDNQAPDITYHWRVRATLDTNIYTAWSQERTYRVLPLDAPRITGPGNDVDVTDIVLDWEPVPGAAHYELQADDDYDFNSPENVPRKIYATRYSPPTTWGNDQYYWRVRAVDADGNPTAWLRLPDGEHYEFDRVWRDIPKPVHPLGSTDTTTKAVVVGDDLYFEWTPVRHASRYELWLSTDPYFTDNGRVTWRCQLVGTTYTPGEFQPVDACMPMNEGQTYYWKVRALDLPYPKGVEGIFSEAQRFVHQDSTRGQPGDVWRVVDDYAGTEVAVPTADWEPVNGTATYKVELLNGSGLVVQSATTRSTSWTPPGEVEADGGPYRWRFTARDEAGRTTTTVTLGWTFDVADDVPASGVPLEPVAGPATYDAPNLRWNPHPEAAYYRIRVKDLDADVWYADSSSELTKTAWHYPAATDLGAKFLTEGSFNWQVTAHRSNGTAIHPAGAEGTFTVKRLAPVTGQRIALTGSSLDRGKACAKLLTAGSRNWCDSVPATPVLDWDPVPYASFYRVYVSRDADFTTGLLEDVAPATTNTRWAPRTSYKAKALADSQASTAYYWYIQPCKSLTQCSTDPRSTVNPAKNAFRKTSPAVELLSPAHVPDPKNPSSVVSTSEVTFTWKDYFDTNRATTYVETGEKSYQSGQTYRIEVSTDPTFASTIDRAVVDQPTYTAPTNLYPEGTLYWRVQVNDGGDNKLTWSPTRTFVKRSAAPVLASPVNGAKANGSTPFRWRAQAYATSYELQVAANADVNFSAGNLVVKRTSKRPAITTGFGTKTLPTSSKPYVWRVRRIDSSGKPGPWSPTGQFTVTSENPQQVTPAPGATVQPAGAVFRWKAAPRTSRNRVSYRVKGGNATTTTTSASAFAPAGALRTSTAYEWRVESLSGDGQVIGDSGWRGFTTRAAALPPTAKPVASKTKVTVKKKIKAGKKKKVTIKVTVKVTAKGAKPRGKVKVYAGKKVVGTGKLKANGKVAVKTKALKRGTHKIKVKYLGQGAVKKSTSKTVKVKIVR